MNEKSNLLVTKSDMVASKRVLCEEIKDAINRFETDTGLLVEAFQVTRREAEGASLVAAVGARILLPG